MPGEIEALTKALAELRRVKQANLPAPAQRGRASEQLMRGLQIAESVLKREIAQWKRSCRDCGGSGLAPNGEAPCPACDGGGLAARAGRG